MTAWGHTWTAFAAATRIGFAELAAIYTWRTWLLGWFVRLVTQAVFFALFGLLLGGAALVHYRAVGNTVVLVCVETSVVVLGTVRERNAGTLALQLVAPTPYVLTFLARGVYTLLVGVASSTAAFAIVLACFRVPVAMPAALLAPLFIAVVGLSGYCFALFVGVVVMHSPAVQWLALNLTYLTVMTVCGVNVPVDYWPDALRAVAQVLPLTHGLAAVRGLLGGGPLAGALPGLCLELLVGVLWLTAAVLLLRVAVHRGRHTGSVELSG
ncbi:ABC transporter permease [Virgisporangium aurantiacum]|uniref:ABC-2 type transporter transmembrane domain-containing protein n=1 Tax=Virgisporangium aurantiacum TaxID=175570 RepID=A0A8J3ZIL6_9ACTN|nr:ABC transporter permease [Virgisporangium aurantiacum]GIJ62210.1 hypothetical protein Vau01_097260 [Virgisporangium aurantiacum]